MIQRIQSVYLLIAVVLVGVLYFFPFANFVVEQDMSMYHISIKGLLANTPDAKPIFSVIPLIIVISVTIIALIISIMLFKRRMFQIKICITSIILLLGLQGLIYYYISVSKQQLGAHISYTIVFVFPIIAAILTYLAIRKIAKDEALVRSADRLR